MGIQKKKNVIVIATCAISSFIVYQMYFFFMISTESGSSPPNQRILYAAIDVNGNRVIPVLDPNELDENDVVQLRSDDDKFINNNGLIRGVLFSHMRKYRGGADNPFKCLNSEQTIPYSQVNDDYCDCEDGTDEPSTSACPNGTFYCDFQYFKKQIQLNMVPSGKVNDGICDCCDGSDEFDRKYKQYVSQFSRNARHYVDDCPNIC